MSRVGKTLDKMRANPRDWRIDQLKAVADAHGVAYRQPGTSHVTFRHPSGSRVVLPPPRPLRTRRASFPAPGSSLGKAPRSTRRADEALLHDLELPAAGGAVNLRRFWFKFSPHPVGLQCGQWHALSKVTAPVEPVRLGFVIQDPSEVCPLSG